MSDDGTASIEFRVRPAKVSDANTIVRFVKQLALFEKEPLENVQLTEEAVLKHAFGNKPRFEVLIAESDAAPVGMVLYFENYSTWTGLPGIWVEELFVEEPYRGAGIGRTLIESVRKLANQRGYGRVELAVLDWNPAVEFYKAQGFETLEEWTTFRLPIR